MVTAELPPEIATVCLAIGMVMALVCYLATSLSPGGMITPGWLALTLVVDYRQTALIMGVAIATLGLTKLLRRIIILYGKRLFAAVVLIGVLLQLSLFFSYPARLSTPVRPPEPRIHHSGPDRAPDRKATANVDVAADRRRYCRHIHRGYQRSARRRDPGDVTQAPSTTIDGGPDE